MSPAVFGNRAKSMYFAQPYNIGAVGFHFADLEEYRANFGKVLDEFGTPVEEFEIQYIDGDEAALFEAVGVNQANLAAWFNLLDELDGDEDRTYIACHLASLGYPLDELSTRWDDYSVYHGTPADYAEDYIRDCYTLPGSLEYYIDYDRLGRDMMIDGSITKLEYNLLLVAGHDKSASP